eukprot:TRINITY_DN7059_c1_g1_i4.p1 TRINITY_DN7059_c1_g1~~TRINITY_DN7059_c1_g1_i4.p1  ORF type:complete len:387 (+),score=83.17 TRINITY_DN7059_c1_g1_i4:106-1161(+)
MSNNENSDDNVSLQQEELLVLSSIFGEDDFLQTPPLYTLLLRSNVDDQREPLCLQFSFPAKYPTSAEHPPSFTINCPWLSHLAIDTISQHLRNIYTSEPQVIIYQWGDWLKDHAHEFSSRPLSSKDNSISNNNRNNDMVSSSSSNDLSEGDQDDIVNEHHPSNDDEDDVDDDGGAIPFIYHGEAVTDRKSKFQAHLAEVHSLEEVRAVIGELLKDKKIATATHPTIYAFRFRDDDPSSSTLETHRDDDGETGAGDKLLYLLEKMPCENMLVVVTRWYGGINLGNDRFKHITNVARDIIEQTRPIIEEKHKASASAAAGGPRRKHRPADEVYNTSQSCPHNGRCYNWECTYV